MRTNVVTFAESEPDARLAALYAEGHHLLSYLTPRQLDEALPVLRRFARPGGGPPPGDGPTRPEGHRGLRIAR